MANNQEKMLYNGTSAAKDPEKAAMPFVKAWSPLAMNIKAKIPLQRNAVF